MVSVISFMGMPLVGLLIISIIVLSTITPVLGNLTKVIINPEITATDGTQKEREGCLSIPGYYAPIKRAKKIEVKYSDIEGKEIVTTYAGFPAVVFQHAMPLFATAL